MSGSYRFTLLRAQGWGRAGIGGAAAAAFGSPILWSLGAFGDHAEAVRRAAVFATSGICFFLTTGFLLGWTVRGFLVRVRDADDEETHPHRPAAPHAAPAAHGASAAPVSAARPPAGH